MAVLTSKQAAFIDEYMICLNGTEAAARAGYRGTRATLATVAFENLRKPKILASIQERFQARMMSAEEVVDRVCQMARASVGEFIVVGVDGFTVDLEAVKARGYLVKRLRETKDGAVELELYSAQEALGMLGKYHKLFREGLDVEVKTVERFTADDYGKAAGEVDEWERERFGVNGSS